MTTISIALATYNGERFLREQLESLAKQSRLPDELVVADDGSTDRTLGIVREFAVRAPFQTIILPSEGRLGYRANFMRCAQHCKGDLIAFCDQDDLWDAEKLLVVEATIEPSTTLLQHDFRVIDADANPLPGNMDEIGISDGDRWAPVLGLVQVFRRSLLEFWPLWELSIDQNIPSERMAHDQWVYFLSGLERQVQIIREPLLCYRQHGGNTCGLVNHNVSYKALRPLAILKDLLRARPESREVKKSLILNGLRGYGSAAESRVAIISRMIQESSSPLDLTSLMRESAFYIDLASYCARRSISYGSSSLNELFASLLQTQLQYFRRGQRGIKDFLLDAVLNV